MRATNHSNRHFSCAIPISTPHSSCICLQPFYPLYLNFPPVLPPAIPPNCSLSPSLKHSISFVPPLPPTYLLPTTPTKPFSCPFHQPFSCLCTPTIPPTCPCPNLSMPQPFHPIFLQPLHPTNPPNTFLLPLPQSFHRLSLSLLPIIPPQPFHCLCPKPFHQNFPGSVPTFLLSLGLHLQPFHPPFSCHLPQPFHQPSSCICPKQLNQGWF